MSDSCSYMISKERWSFQLPYFTISKTSGTLSSNLSATFFHIDGALGSAMVDSWIVFNYLSILWSITAARSPITVCCEHTWITHWWVFHGCVILCWLTLQNWRCGIYFTKPSSFKPNCFWLQVLLIAVQRGLQKQITILQELRSLFTNCRKVLEYVRIDPKEQRSEQDELQKGRDSTASKPGCTGKCFLRLASYRMRNGNYGLDTRAD